MAWTHIPHYWPFVRGIHRSSMDSHQHDKKGPVMRSFDIFHFISLSKPLGKKSSFRRFETQWRSYDVIVIHLSAMVSLYTRKDFYNTHDLFIKAHYIYAYFPSPFLCTIYCVFRLWAIIDTVVVLSLYLFTSCKHAVVSQSWNPSYKHLTSS